MNEEIDHLYQHDIFIYLFEFKSYDINKIQVSFCKTSDLDLREIYLEPLSNIVITQTQKFTKIKIFVLAAISSAVERGIED